jgi:uncharacterized protein (DUF1330 family)
MGPRTRFALAVIAAFALGGAVVEGLHAQAKAKPPVYVVAEIDVTDVDGYVKEFAPKAQALIKRSGATLLAAGQNVTAFEGRPPAKRVAIQRWDSLEQYKAYRDSPEFKENRMIGDKYATFRAFAVEGVPQH